MAGVRFEDVDLLGALSCAITHRQNDGVIASRRIGMADRFAYTAGPITKIPLVAGNIPGGATGIQTHLQAGDLLGEAGSQFGGRRSRIITTAAATGGHE